jgi:hypothetical protein
LQQRNQGSFAQKAKIPPTEVGGYFQILATDKRLPGNLIPPTAVGGYFKFGQFGRSLRKAKMNSVDLNNLPIAVGRISLVQEAFGC